VVTAIALGSTQVAASSGGRSGLATVTVQRPPVASVVVRPSQVDALAGERIPLSAVPYDAGGNALGDRIVSWSSSNESVATVDPAGLVAAVSVGSATITATSEGQSETATVTVREGAVASVGVVPSSVSMIVGQTTPLAVALRNAGGAPVTNRAVVWASSNAGVATVTAEGVVTARGAGTATVTATSEGVTGKADVVVAKAPVQSVAIVPQTLPLDVRSTAVLHATVVDANGVTVTDRAVSWASSSQSVATVSPNGTVTAVAPGTTTITATSEGKTGTATITVRPPPVASVAVSPTTKSMAAGQTTALAATLRDASGAVLTDRIVSWSSSSATVATVSQTGVVTALGAGTATITATSEGKSGTASVAVQAGPAATVDVTPTSTTIRVSRTVQLTAVAHDAQGNLITGRTFSWTPSDTRIASVSSTGVVTGRKTGIVTITATLDGRSGASKVTVTP
jgi:uncharacterized protein YjdB